MKEKIFNAYKSGNLKEFNRIIDRLRFMYHDEDYFRIIDMCQDFGISTASQYLDDNVLSYAVFNSKKINDKYYKDNIIVVNKNLSNKEKRVLYAFHFFQYLLSDSNKEEYHLCDDFDTNSEYYKYARELLLPEKKIIKECKKLNDYSYFETSTLNFLSDKYLVPFNDVRRRMIDLSYFDDNKIFLKKI